MSAVTDAQAPSRIRFRPGYLALALGAVVVAVLPLLFTTRYSTNLLILGAAMSIGTLGLVVVLGYAGQISLAQAAFYGIGAYAVALGTTRWEINWWLALLLGLIAATVAGAVLGMATLKLGGHYLAMVTICFQVIFTLVLTNWVAVTGGPDGISNIKRPPFFVPLNSAQRYAWFALAALLLVGALVWWLRDTVLGRSMRAVRENEIAAEALGVNTPRVKVIAFTFSALIGALGGAIYASGYLYISPDTFNFDHAVAFLAMVLVGGTESVLGAILGASLLTFLPEWLRELKKIYLVIYGCVIILVIVFMPEGLWGYAKLLGRRFARVVPLPPAPRPVQVGGRGTAGEEILRIEKLTKRFGGLVAVDEVDLVVRRGEAHALIGPNGSGKTTCINLLSGLYVPTAGRIRFLGQEIAGRRPSRIAVSGMARSFQNLRLFRELSVWENDPDARAGGHRVRGADGQGSRDLPEPTLRPPKARRAGPRHRGRAGTAAVGRARGRSEPDGEAGAGAAAQAAERDGAHDPDRGARHVPRRQGRLGCHCSQLRQENRRRNGGRGAAAFRGGGGVSRQQGGGPRCLRYGTFTSPTGP
jgi:branched-chain amino acid transport system permease protein